MIQSNLICKYKKYTNRYIVINVNAKDPVLAKLNAGPKMISLYTSGVMLGLSVEEIARLALSDTGILLSKICEGDAFEGDGGFKRLEQAINYLNRPPQLNFDDDILAQIKLLLERLGYQINNSGENSAKLTNSKFAELIANGNNRIGLEKLLKFLYHPNENSNLLTFNIKDFAYTQIRNLRNSRDFRRFSKRAAEYLAALQQKQTDGDLTEEEEKTLNELNDSYAKKQAIQEQINILQQLANSENPSEIVSQLPLEILNALNNAQNLSKEKPESLKLLTNAIFTTPAYTESIKNALDWIEYRRITDNDYIDNEYDSYQRNVLKQISRLNEFSQEMANLRPILALNQGLPNKLEDQLNWISEFGSIITKRLDNVDKTRIPNLDETLAKLEKANDELRTEGKIYNSDKYYVDLNNFIYNPEYNKIVKEVYDKIKFGINVLRVADGVPHYKTYLTLMNLLVQSNKALSKVYETALKENDITVPEMHANSAQMSTDIRKNLLSAIYRNINKQYLRSQNQVYKIPRFTIVNGSPKILGGFEYIRLGYDDQKFRDWVQFIEFPRMQKEYPDNAFIKYLGFRSYDYNEDKNESINIAKIKQLNSKSPASLVEFDSAKEALTYLKPSDIDKLFYYNIVAYNNQAGQLSLTSLFEDLMAANNFESIINYNKFMSPTSNIKVEFTQDLRVLLAPLVSEYEVKKCKAPFIRVRDRDTEKVFLLQKGRMPKSEDPDAPENQDEGTGPKSFEVRMDEAGYHIPSISVSEAPDYPYSLRKEGRNYVVEYKGKTYKVDDIKKLAKDKGVKNLTSVIISKTLDGHQVFDPIATFGKLDLVFNDNINNCK